MFTAIHDLRLTDRGQRSQLKLTIRISAASPAAPAAVAGIHLGWEQLTLRWPISAEPPGH